MMPQVTLRMYVALYTIYRNRYQKNLMLLISLLITQSACSKDVSVSKLVIDYTYYYYYLSSRNIPVYS